MVESGASSPEDPAASSGPLAPGRVEVLTLRMDGVPADCLAALRRLLSPEEIERNERFRFARDRDLHAAGRGLLRILLSRHAPRDQGEWSIRTEPSGRPMVANPIPGMALDFNISHTPGLVAVAVGRDVRVGLDVEGSSDLFSEPGIARTILHPEEARTLRLISPNGRAGALHRLWVLKEAYGKARGTGLTEDIRDVAFASDDTGSIHLRHAGTDRSAEGTDWWFHEEELDDGFRLALAVHAPGHLPHHIEVGSFDCSSLPVTRPVGEVR